MRLIALNVIKAVTCGGLLDGFDVEFRAPGGREGMLLCLIGPNGSGKSQMLQILAEVFQAIIHQVCPEEEREDGNPELQFEVEYEVKPRAGWVEHVKWRRTDEGDGPELHLSRWSEGLKDWEKCDARGEFAREVIPAKIIGYTSGGNETLSLPFFLSRSRYAVDVRNAAVDKTGASIPDTRLLMLDYGTHLEILVANLLLGRTGQVEHLLRRTPARDLHSFRCIIQLEHAAARRFKVKGERGILLTDELRRYIDALCKCSTCYNYDEVTRSYVLDFLVGEATRAAFQEHWPAGPFSLYTSFHKLAMLNNLMIPREARLRFEAARKERRFASQLPEAQDEEKVFRFDRVCFVPKSGGEPVEYVSLSDGEHQLVQILGIFSMMSTANVLFLLDEPESHFNPVWRAKFMSDLMSLPIEGGTRNDMNADVVQDCLLTTHAPFVPSDLHRENVFIFSKLDGGVVVSRPGVETYGATFDTIMEECFKISPPISRQSLEEIEALLKSNDIEEIESSLERLGYSIRRTFLVDRLRRLRDARGGR